MVTSPMTAKRPVLRTRTRRLMVAGSVVALLGGGGLAAASVLAEPRPDPVVAPDALTLRDAAFVVAGLPAPKSDVSHGWLTSVASDGVTTSVEIAGATSALQTGDDSATCLATDRERIRLGADGVRRTRAEGEPLAVAVRSGECLEVRSDARATRVVQDGRLIAEGPAIDVGAAGVDDDVVWVLDPVGRRLVALPLDGGEARATRLRGVPRDLLVRSAPTAYAGRVHALAQVGDELRLLSLDPRTGRVGQLRVADVGPGRVDVDDLGPRRDTTIHALTDDGVVHAVDLATRRGRVLLTLPRPVTAGWSHDALVTATEEGGELRLDAYALDTGRRTTSVRTAGLAPLIERDLHSWVLGRR